MSEPARAPTHELAVLGEGLAFALRRGYRTVRISGSDAETWLNDLVTAGVEGMAEGRALRSLLLSPTGHVRAEFNVARTGEGLFLLQDPSQERSIADLLTPYVLSSDVELADRSEHLALISLTDPGAGRVGWPGIRPSVLGPGMDLLVPPKETARFEYMLMKKGLTGVSEDALEVHRIGLGIPRYGLDFGEGSLPAEAGLEGTIDFTKGCFLGQESVAKVRNLGHPPRVLRVASVDGQVGPGEPVLAGGAPVGEITSAAVAGSSAGLICRVAWTARDADLSLADGRVLASP